MSCTAFPERRGGKPRATYEHMPFFGHRTVAEVWEEEARKEILRDLGKDVRVRG